MALSALSCTLASNTNAGTPLGAASATALQAGTGSWTMGAFVKFNSLPGLLMPLMSKWNNGVAGGQEYLLTYVNGPGTFAIVAGDASNTTHELDGTVKSATGVWYFVVASYDSAAALLHLYVNDVADGTPVACPNVLNGPTAFRLGAAYNPSGWALDGSMAMAFKYQGLVSSGNRTWLYNGGLGRTAAAILAQPGLTTPDFLYGFDDPAALGTDSGPNALALAPVFSTGPGRAAGPPGLATVLSDGFAGTAGTSVTSRTPDAVPYASQVWGGPVPAQGGGPMAIAAGGVGATSSGGSGPPWSEYFPLTGGPTDYTASFTWTNSGASTVPTVFLRVDSGGQNFLALDFHYGNHSVYLSKMVAGTYTGSYASAVFTFATGTAYTAVATLSGTSLTLTINGTAVFVGQAVPAAAGPGIAIRQQLGAAGDTVFTSARVQLPSATAVTLTGPATLAAGVASSNYTATLDRPAPDGGLSLPEAATVFAATFSPQPLAIAAGALTGTFTATSSTTGTGTITATPPGGIAVTPVPVTSSPPSSPTACTVTGPATITDGIPATFTFTLNAPAPSGGTSIVPAATGFSATFGTNPIVIASGATSGTTTVNASSAAPGTVTGTSSGIAFTAASTTASAPASSYTLTGPSPASGPVGVASGNFVVQANGVPATSLVVTPSAGAGGGTFSPASLTLATAAAATFTYTPGTAGSKSIAVTHTGGTGVAGDPAAVAYTANPRALTLSPATIPAGATTTVTFTVAGAAFQTSAPSLSVSGVVGVSVGSATVVSNSTFTAPVTAGATGGTATYTEATTATTATQSVVVTAPTYVAADLGATGLAGTAGFVVYRLDGTVYQARAASVATVAGLPAGTGYTGSFPAVPGGSYLIVWDDGATPPNYTNPGYVNPPVNVVAVGNVAAQYGDGVASAVTSNTITIPSAANLANYTITVLSASAGKDQSAVIASSGTPSNGQAVQTLTAPWGITPTGTVVYQLSPPTNATLGAGAITASTVDTTAVAKLQAGLPASVASAVAAGPVASVGNLAGVAFSGGTVAANGTSTTFTATGSGLNATPGGYLTAPMYLLWQAGANAGFKYAITGHTVSGSAGSYVHNFTVGTPMANPAAAGDTFVIG